jgi:hypothetical protein
MAHNTCKHLYKIDGEYSERALTADRHFSRRSRQKHRLAERIAAELDRNEWTYIDENNPATLPPDSGISGRWYLAVWTNGKEKRAGKSSFEGGVWYYFGFGSNLQDRGWRAYAWKPWPALPPLPSEGGEQ